MYSERFTLGSCHCHPAIAMRATPAAPLPRCPCCTEPPPHRRCVPVCAMHLGCYAVWPAPCACLAPDRSESGCVLSQLLPLPYVRCVVCVGNVQVVQAISDLRDAVDGPDDIDQGICECRVAGSLSGCRVT